MTIIIVITSILTIMWIIRSLRVFNIIGSSTAEPTIHVERQLRDPFGKRIKTFRIYFMGSLQLPPGIRQAVAVLRIYDVTDREHPIPVRSLATSTADADGLFYHEHYMTVPNSAYSFNQRELALVPLNNLVAPYKGKRTLEFRAQFLPVDDTIVVAESACKLEVMLSPDHIPPSTSPPHLSS